MKGFYADEDDSRIGIMLIVGAVFLLSFSDALIKYLSDGVSLWQLYLARSFIAVPLLLWLLLRHGGVKRLRPRSFRWVALRSALLITMWLCYYAALPLMPFSVAAVVFYTSPLFMALFSPLLLGEAVGAKGWAGILIGFCGVLVMLRPDGDAFSPALLLPLLAAVCYSLVSIVTRRYCHHERPVVLSLGLNLGFLIVGAGVSTLLALWPPSPSDVASHPFLLSGWQPLGLREWGLLIVLGLLIVVVSIAVARAYQAAPAPLVGAFDYGYLPFAGLWGLVLFAEVPDAATLTGMTLVAVAGMLVFQQSRIPARRYDWVADASLRTSESNLEEWRVIAPVVMTRKTPPAGEG
ncbi:MULTISPECIES: DMT family transporter [Halomonadaceae]|uniref:DMT family transporter n=1 Tax=Halomonadaceae TaxID=28256 RepID=UPI0015995C43|nr:MULTISPECIES: DMT family transporter [Halomonas]QJQ96324.1 DMT family transporter [Halomonas sp. PA5]